MLPDRAAPSGGTLAAHGKRPELLLTPERPSQGKGRPLPRKTAARPSLFGSCQHSVLPQKGGYGVALGAHGEAPPVPKTHVSAGTRRHRPILGDGLCPPTKAERPHTGPGPRSWAPRQVSPRSADLPSCGRPTRRSEAHRAPPLAVTLSQPWSPSLSVPRVGPDLVGGRCPHPLLTDYGDSPWALQLLPQPGSGCQETATASSLQGLPDEKAAS